MPGLSSWGIFLSYRREDAAPYMRLLKLELGHRIPDAPVFMDLDSIEPGLDFAEVIREAVDSCIVLVALIGPQWATLVDEEGRRRIDNPDDWVRFELGAALKRKVRVIPVLVGGARPLRSQQLPVELKQLARLNALELSNDRYEYDADKLLSLLQRILAKAADADTGRQSPPGANVEPFTDSLTDYPAEFSPHIRIVTSTDRDGLRITDAERHAQSITENLKNASFNAMFAEALAAINPDLAERHAQSITDDYYKAYALVRIVRALAATDPDRAARLIADAERTAQSITDDSMKASALASMAETRAVTGLDP